MLFFHWQVLDDISNYEFTFDPKTEEVEIYGEFGLNSNGAKFGNLDDYPEPIRFKMYGSEDIMHVLNKFKNKVIPLENGKEVEILFLQNCLDRFYIAREDDVFILRQLDRTSGKENWAIKMDCDEFIEETKRNIKLFIEYIRKENPALLENTSVKSLAEGIVKI